MKKLVLMLLTTVAMQSQTQNYTSSSEVFANPERGWHKYTIAQSTTTYALLTQSSLTSYRTTDKSTLILRVYDLGAFKTTPISQTYLANIQKDFDALRASGVKAIIRFRYTEVDAIDASKAQILAHIDQLKTVTLPNQDVICSIEAGFIGEWGEWYYSSNFGTGSGSALTAQNLADRKEVGLKIMELAPDRMVAFRTTKYQTLIGGSSPLTTTEAHNGTINSRIALHNDALLSSSSDMGTFSNTTTEYPYLENQSKYTFCGGESCQLNTTYQNCTNALYSLNRFHYSHLNSGYFGATLDLWKTSGCFDEIQRRLGYRFELLNSTIASNTLTLNLQNVGFANAINERKAYLVMKNTSTNVEYPFLLNTDVRLWESGSQTQIIQSLDLDVPIGNYQLFLNLPDSKIANPLFSIQCANIGTWDAVKGYNNLNQTYAKTTLTPVVVAPAPVVVEPTPVVVEPTPVVVEPVQIILSSTYIIMVYNLPQPNFTIGVYNLSGRLKSTSVNISNLKNGTYIVKVTSNGVVYTQKIYKQ